MVLFSHVGNPTEPCDPIGSLGYAAICCDARREVDSSTPTPLRGGVGASPLPPNDENQIGDVEV